MPARAMVCMQRTVTCHTLTMRSNAQVPPPKAGVIGQRGERNLTRGGCHLWGNRLAVRFREDVGKNDSVSRKLEFGQYFARRGH